MSHQFWHPFVMRRLVFVRILHSVQRWLGTMGWRLVLNVVGHSIKPGRVGGILASVGLCHLIVARTRTLTLTATPTTSAPPTAAAGTAIAFGGAIRAIRALGPVFGCNGKGFGRCCCSPDSGLPHRSIPV